MDTRNTSFQPVAGLVEAGHATDLSLQRGQDLSMAATAGTELFCANGTVRVTCVGLDLPARSLQAGQALRVPTHCLLLVSGLEPSRCRWTAAPDAVQAQPPAKKNSLRPWGRRLSPDI